MTEILWIGRGGQGAFTAAKLLGAAYSIEDDGHYALAFPSFGPERRGAPVRAFTKLDLKPILDRSQTQKADYIVILDETLYSEKLKTLLKPDGKLIINSRHFNEEGAMAYWGKALQDKFHLPTANTIMLSVLAKESGFVSLEALQTAIESYMPAKIAATNKEVTAEVLREVQV